MLRLRNSRRRRKKKGKGAALLSGARWLTLVLAAIFLAWSVFLPSASGALGGWIHARLLEAFGLGAFLIPLMVFLGLLWAFRTENWKGLLTMALGAAVSLTAACLLLGALGPLFARPAWGGALGGGLAGWGVSMLGRPGTVLIGLAGTLLGLQVLFGIPWSTLLAGAFTTLRDDYRDWLRGRRELGELISDAAKRHLPRPAEGPGMEPAPEPARREDAPPPAAEDPAPPAAEKPAPAARKPAKKRAKERKEAPEPAPKRDGAPYVLPPLDLLEAQGAGSVGGRPSDAELEDGRASLERSFNSFDIDAKVSGISPGPVITRYEVSPAPGVKVASIMARSDDIALAMKAKALRMIKAIPGKGTMGIEVPNREGVVVRLREVLASKAMDGMGPLAFALGLSSDGNPLAADLRSMPHVLVAGATNSGKSVMVHSLICSILFRQPPEMVKFLLIDPKRIELTLYDGIPHLYDPRTRPEEVRVITDSKRASRALQALVQVMDHRYERFEAYRVRDIRAFNQEAARRGERGESYIVVVIDELADLMVVARDDVEDSIQRLTQMARAVGIHMVIATQRPSVDVLTGVIKANLPCRIAMHVGSKVDSKVIIDGSGAEALLGKGDALYMAPGQDTMRIQGCLVSTPEIGAAVDHLRTQGNPEYPILGAMVSAVGEEDLSQYGVEPQEFARALKLVLDRRRVSQDLLKSQFGSSARATNLLSLLEVKGFIHKPETSNRWTIHFEKIEDYLRTHYPQI